MRAKILIQEGVSSPKELAALSSRALMRMLNMEQDEAITIIERAKIFQSSNGANVPDAETAELLANSSAAPQAPSVGAAESSTDSDSRNERVKLFSQLQGVGEAAAHALADAGYGTIGDVIADTGEEVAHKTGLPIGVARTIQMAADRFLQKQAEKASSRDED
jgi:N utilization substance protein A